MAKQVLWGLVLLGLLAFLYRVRTVLTPFLFAIVIAYILYPLVVAVEQRGCSRWVAIFVVYAIFGLVLGVVFWVAVPRLIEEMEEISKHLPEQIERWELLGQKTLGLFRKMPLPAPLRDVLNMALESAKTALEVFVDKALQMLVGVFTHLISLLIAPVLAFYLLRDHHAMRERALKYIPAPWRGRAQTILQEINVALNGFFRGQILVSLFVGAFIYAGLWILKIPYALFIGFMAGIFDIIPYFGPILGFIPAATLALLRSPLTVLWVLALFVGANQIENAIISPKIIGDKVGLHPLIVILALFIGGDLLGIMGMLLAIPVAAIIRVILEHLLYRRTC